LSIIFEDGRRRKLNCVVRRIWRRKSFSDKVSASEDKFCISNSFTKSL
jgi:hypothetical protein